MTTMAPRPATIQVVALVPITKGNLVVLAEHTFVLALGLVLIPQ
jgi:hypothetical protein